jgi:hypothetical protein
MKTSPRRFKVTSQTHCAWGGHFVTCAGLRIVLPLVGIKVVSTDGRTAEFLLATIGVRVTK